MMKAVLVIDKMPNSCGECIVRCDGYTAKEYAQRTIIKPNWCPLRSIPNKAAEDLIKGLDALEKMQSVEVRTVRRIE